MEVRPSLGTAAVADARGRLTVRFSWALSAIVVKLYTPTNYIYTLSVLRHPNVTFCKERVYSPCRVRESLGIGYLVLQAVFTL